METKVGLLKGAEWAVTKARVAVAVAIIKNKPPGLSGRQFSEALACRLKNQDEGWKIKAQELQQEVLRLRQEVLIARVTPRCTEEAGRDDSLVEASQDLFGPESGSHLHPGCDSETPDFLLQDPHPTVTSCHRPGVAAMLPHVCFLQSLCALRRVEGEHGGLEQLWLRPDVDAGSVLVESVCQLLESVVAACRDPARLGPGDHVLQACRVAARAMDLFCSQRLPAAEFMRRVEESLAALTGMLLHCDQLSGVPTVSDLSVRSEELTETLITLGSSSMSKSFLIPHILSHISALADQLWQALQGQETSGLDKFPVDPYHNSCHLFWILEKLLQDSKVQSRAEARSEQMGFLTHMEQRVFLLSSEFPMFSIYMWRIGQLLAPADR